MTDFKNMRFSSSDVIKAITGLVFFGTMWVDLKTDQLNCKRDREFLQYQIDEIRQNKGLAILPKKIRIERR